MRRILLLACLALPAYAQQAQRPLPEEVEFARLAPELQSMLAHLPPAEALRQVQFARQNLIALGQPNPSREQMRKTVQAVISPPYGVGSQSAGETSLPPLSPLVAPPPPVLGR
ncbi:MAG: hypothetical protein K0R40_2599 [Burkholderiales bacterium]|jgi:hypothetical protein|nr:hypothetical protein [Burkholderiales bacterium]